MKYSLTLAAAGFVLPAVLASPQSIDNSCGDCRLLEQKETDCSKSEMGLQEHAECMCSNNFFSEWRSCRTCLFNVEQTSKDIYDDNMQAIGRVYDSFCVAKQPQAIFSKAFGDALGNSESTTAVSVGSVSASSTTRGDSASASVQDSTASQSTGGSVVPTITAASTRATSLTASGTATATVSGTASRITSSSSSSGSRITPGTGRNSTTTSSALPTGAAVPAVQAAPGLAMALLGAAALMGL